MAKVIAIRTEVFSRVVGYYRPVDEWNLGKQAEYSERESISIEWKENEEDA